MHVGVRAWKCSRRQSSTTSGIEAEPSPGSPLWSACEAQHALSTSRETRAEAERGPEAYPLILLPQLTQKPEPADSRSGKTRDVVLGVPWMLTSCGEHGLGVTSVLHLVGAQGWRESAGCGPSS